MRMYPIASLSGIQTTVKNIIGTPEQWAEAQGVMQKILDHLGLDYAVGVGEAAFYGPKLDIQIKNVHGKRGYAHHHPDRSDARGKIRHGVYGQGRRKKRPLISIHRTSIGCYERTLALLIEKYAGAFPLWLAPEQARILPISERHHDTARAVYEKLCGAGLRVELDERSEKIGYKIREAQLQKIPYMLVVGDKEAESGTVSVRMRGEGDIGAMAVDDFLARALLEVAEKKR